MNYLTDERLPLTTVIEMSTLVDRAAFGGLHLAYLPRYVPGEDAAFAKSDDVQLAEFIAGLKVMFPDLLPEQIVACRIARARHVLAVPTQHYSRGTPPLATSVPSRRVVPAWNSHSPCPVSGSAIASPRRGVPGYPSAAMTVVTTQRAGTKTGTGSMRSPRATCSITRSSGASSARAVSTACVSGAPKRQ